MDITTCFGESRSPRLSPRLNAAISEKSNYQESILGLRRHASCPPGTLRQINLATDPTRQVPSSATRSLLVTRDDQARAPSAVTSYSASVSSPINPPDSSWVHLSTTTQALLELESKAKDVRITPETGSFNADYPPGLGCYTQMYIEPESPLNAWTDPFVYGHYDEYPSPIHIHTCSSFVPSSAHTPSSLLCPACNDSMEEAFIDNSATDRILQAFASMALEKDVRRKDKKQVPWSPNSIMNAVMDQV